ncbi:MAG: phospholipase D-like domain-containing protein [Rhodothalassiaceae bacterium]
MDHPMLSALAGAVHVLLSILATLHILRSKQDVRAAIGWVAAAWFAPFFGPFAYFLLGINRIRRHAEARRGRLGGGEPPHPGAEKPALDSLDPTAAPRFVAHAELAARLTGYPLVPDNAIEMLIDGDAAYPAMLEAIAAAKDSILLSTYIYDWDPVGRSFAEALVKAKARGVRVHVLVDAVGSLGIARRLRTMGLDAKAFNPPGLQHLAFLNLRTHRKLLLIDGRIGFSGGMNIRGVHRSEKGRPLSVRDIMYRIEGPVIGQLFEVFEEDWRFATSERLPADMRPAPRADRPSVGAVMRAAPDGPEDEISIAGWILESALAVARRQVRITTPYFLPDLTLMSALSQAALRGVRVDILVPERSDHRLVGWASEAHFPLLVERGCHIHLTPAPFDHTKLMVVDGYWAFIGSSNWDMRSLRLNFELNIEIYDSAFAQILDRHLADRIRSTRRIAPEELPRLGSLRHYRNRAAWLLSPYL